MYNLKARDLMSTPVITISMNATVGEAADLMLNHRVSTVPVLDNDGNLVGIMNHADFGLHHKFVPLADNIYTCLGTWTTPDTVEETARKIRSKLVKDVMRHDVVTVDENASIPDLAELMLDKKVNRLPVRKDGRLEGIITRHDLLKLFSSRGKTP